MAKRWTWIWVLALGALAHAQDETEGAKRTVFPRRAPGAKHLAPLGLDELKAAAEKFQGSVKLVH